MINGRIFAWMETACFTVLTVIGVISYAAEHVLNIKNSLGYKVSIVLYLVPVLIAGICALIYEFKTDKETKTVHFRKEVLVIVSLNLISGLIWFLLYRAGAIS